MANQDTVMNSKYFRALVFLFAIINAGLGSLENSFNGSNSDSVPGTKPSLSTIDIPMTTGSVLDWVNSPVKILRILRTMVVYTSLFENLQDKALDTMITNTKCFRDLARLSNATASGETWTFTFSDASGKPGPSMSKGWLTFVGNFDQCKEASAPATGQAPGFKGENYAVTLSTSIPLLTPRVDLCLPHTCSEQTVKSMAAHLLESSPSTLGLTVSSVQHITNETEVTAATVCCIVVVSILGCLVILGTAFDLVLIQYRPSCTNSCTGQDGHSASGEDRPFEQLSLADNYQKISDMTENPSHESNGISTDSVSRERFAKSFVEFCLTFSAYQNGKALLTVGENRDSLSTIHGLRFLSCCWVILGHTIYFQLEFGLNKAKTYSLKDRWAFGPVANNFLGVDTFFAVSGLLVSYHTLSEINKKGLKIDWLRFYVHRYWRLTPPYMLVLLTSLGLTQYLGTGSLWLEDQPMDKEQCEDKWWKNLLYISNFDGLYDECFGHGWYMACNMQFFAISPFMFVPFYFHYAAGLASCLVFLLSAWILTGVLSSSNDWTVHGFIVFDTLDDKEDWINNFYVKPWCRVGPFVIGVLAGFILTKSRGRSLNLRWWVVALGWLVSTVTALSVVYGLHGDFSGDSRSSTEVAALYNAVARSAWGLSICWIILACDAGYGGPVNAILSLSPFVVLGRLSYMTYLLHTCIMGVVFSNIGYPLYYTGYTFVILFSGFITISTFASFFFMLLFECPMGKLEERYFPKKRKNTTNTN